MLDYALWIDYYGVHVSVLVSKAVQKKFHFSAAENKYSPKVCSLKSVYIVKLTVLED
jgi:hypothetical protein